MDYFKKFKYMNKNEVLQTSMCILIYQLFYTYAAETVNRGTYIKLSYFSFSSKSLDA